jgi:hypothetical protein
MPVMILVSFDIDGTLEAGDPPGPIPMQQVRRAKDLGYLIGSASDRTLDEQRKMWDHHAITVDFVSHKHHLDAVRSRFDCTRLVHIGDTHVDERYAKMFGFEFWFVDRLPADGTEGWIF